MRGSPHPRFIGALDFRPLYTKKRLEVRSTPKPRVRCSENKNPKKLSGSGAWPPIAVPQYRTVPLGGKMGVMIVCSLGHVIGRRMPIAYRGKDERVERVLINYRTSSLLALVQDAAEEPSTYCFAGTLETKRDAISARRGSCQQSESQFPPPCALFPDRDPRRSSVRMAQRASQGQSSAAAAAAVAAAASAV